MAGRLPLVGICLLAAATLALPAGPASAGDVVRVGNETLFLNVTAKRQAKARMQRGARLRFIFERCTVNGM
jgi:hypothetical protein